MKTRAKRIWLFPEIPAWRGQAGRQVRGKRIRAQVWPRAFVVSSRVLTRPASPPRKNPFPSLPGSLHAPARPAVGLCAVPPASPGDCCGMGAAESLRLPTPNPICLREATSPHPLPEQPREPACFFGRASSLEQFFPGGDCFWCHHNFSKHLRGGGVPCHITSFQHLLLPPGRETTPCRAGGGSCKPQQSPKAGAWQKTHPGKKKKPFPSTHRRRTWTCGSSAGG